MSAGAGRQEACGIEGYRFDLFVLSAAPVEVIRSALAMLVPILEEIVGWQRPRIRAWFESHGFLMQEWARVETDWVKLRPAASMPPAVVRVE